MAIMRRHTGVGQAVTRLSLVITLLIVGQAQTALGQASFAEVHEFRFDSAYPWAGLGDGGDGYLYGTTAQGGPGNVGTVYRVKPDGTGFETVHGFSSSDGGSPSSSVVVGGDGYLYGTTP